MGWRQKNLINDVRFFGAILDPPSPPKIGHHLCTFPKETVTYYVNNFYFKLDGEQWGPKYAILTPPS